MMTSVRIATVLAVATAFGCGSESPLAIDQEVALSQAGMLVPFKATQTATPGDASGVVCPPGEQAGKNLVEGEGTYLGTYTGESAGCINPFTGVWSSIDGTLIGANGDVVNTEMDPANPGRFVFIDFATGAFETTGGWLLVSGTGRFDGASGSGTFRSTGNLFVPGSTVTTLEGMISSIGSNK